MNRLKKILAIVVGLGLTVGIGTMTAAADAELS